MAEIVFKKLERPTAMTEDDFMAFARAAAQRVTSKIGQIGHLVLTQTQATKEPTLREPEIRTAFQQEAEARGLLYGIEVPTVYPHQFTGIDERSALVDFALLDSATAGSDRNVLVEFKQGQPGGGQPEIDGSSGYPTISKDLRKLWAEPTHHGCCMFHICQAADSGTIPALVGKYDEVTLSAKNIAADTVTRHPAVVKYETSSEPWFLLLILVLHQRGKNKGSFLHRATWNGSQWVLQEPELLVPVASHSIPGTFLIKA